MSKPKERPTLSTEAYKGTRDFYPEDMYLEKYLFKVMRNVSEKFGYVEYGASILEPSELYLAKTNEEIVNEQTYSFTDRGGRSVTLRPEMTPTIARMVAAKKRELSFPLRWYSIPNLFRYEQPQRGRLREHYQLNIDLFGVRSIEAEVEVISLAYELLREFGAKDTDFEIRINNRKLMAAITRELKVSSEDIKKLMRLVDKRAKLTPKAFNKELDQALSGRAIEFIRILDSKDLASLIEILPKSLKEDQSIREIEQLFLGLRAVSINNVVFSPSLVRGFDYYTGMIFEVYDKKGENRRSLFGGGRYDELLNVFGAPAMPAVGFGMGDVTLRDFLEIRNLIPNYESPIDLYLCRVADASADFVNELAKKLRDRGINVAVDLSERKVGAQIQAADKQKIRFVICLGENEVKTKRFNLKELSSSKETMLSESEVATFLIKAR